MIHDIPQQDAESKADASSIAFVELQKRLDAALRERDETLRQRDELSRQLAAVGQSVPELSLQLDEARKQLASVRRARDAAQAHTQEIADKLTITTDQVGDLQLQLESAEKERDSACERLGDFTRERDELHHAVLDLAEQRAAAIREQQFNAEALVDVQKQLVRISKERDTARAIAGQEAQELIDLDAKLKTLAEEAAIHADETFRIGTFKQTIQRLEAEVARLEPAQREADSLREQLAEAERNRGAAVGAISSAQKQVEFIIRDRDRVRANAAAEKVAMESQVAALQARIVSLQNTIAVLRSESTADAIVFEAQVAALHSQLMSIEEAAADSPEEQIDAPEVAARFREQRARVIELVARLDGAQKRNRELAAQLAEVRAFEVIHPSPAGNILITEQYAGDTADSEAADQPPHGIIDDDLSTMRSLFQQFQTHPDQPEFLQNLCIRTMTLAEHARLAGFQAVASFSDALIECMQWIYRTPSHIGVDSLGSLAQSLDLLCFCSEVGALPRLRDSSNSVVYAVDEDGDNCECISAALSRFVDRTRYALRPSLALDELARTECDLILLDVNLPEMGGFELCRQIRTLEHHLHTPIIFLSDANSDEIQTEATESGGDDFLLKPFDLHELVVRSMTQLVRNQL